MPSSSASSPSRRVSEVHDAMPRELRLAEDIAAQFRHRPTDEAAGVIAQHVRMFWDPRMRARLAAAVAAGPCDPAVAAAAELLDDPLP